MLSDKKLRLTGYIRSGDCKHSVEQQQEMLKQFCEKKGWKLVGLFDQDTDHPSFGLHAALQAVDYSDGLIAVDSQRFISHLNDSLLELRPFIENLMQRNKVFVTIEDGYETVSPSGQETVMRILSEWWNRNEGHRSSHVYLEQPPTEPVVQTN